jgi:hypothetical protein
MVLYFRKKSPSCPPKCPIDGSCPQACTNCPSPSCPPKCPIDGSCPNNCTNCPKPNCPIDCPCPGCNVPSTSAPVFFKPGNNGDATCDDYCKNNRNGPLYKQAIFAYDTGTKNFVSTTVYGSPNKSNGRKNELYCGCAN